MLYHAFQPSEYVLVSVVTTVTKNDSAQPACYYQHPKNCGGADLLKDNILKEVEETSSRSSSKTGGKHQQWQVVLFSWGLGFGRMVSQQPISLSNFTQNIY